MNFFYTIFNLSIKETVILNILIIIFNVFLSFGIRDLVRDNFNKNNSAEKALYLEHKLIKYFYMNVTVLCIAFSSMTLIPHFAFCEEFTFLFVILIALLIYSLEIILLNLILYNINKEIRETSIGPVKVIKSLLKLLITIIVPIIIIFATLEINPFSFFINIIFAVLLIVLFILLMSRIFKKSSEISDAEDEELLTFIKESHVKGIKLKVMKAADNKIANAYARGFFKKQITITDYLLNNFDNDEIKSILAHEIGHIKMNHPLKRTIRVILSFAALISGLYLQDYIGYFGILLLVLLFVFTTFISQFINRYQERKADEYVLLLGFDKYAYAEALYKLYKLNKTIIKFSKFDEKLQTHPSAIKRIKYILGDEFQSFAENKGLV